MRFRRALLFLVVAAVQFAVFEAALRFWGHSEAAPAFTGLFMDDPRIGYRPRPNGRTHYTTDEFETDIAINAQGVRDNADIGAKPRGERRIVVLGDSLVLSVQVDEQQTFCRLLEARLNAAGGATHYRVINAGVQGYGPVEELLFYRYVARAFDPDLVIETIFVGNDAEDAFTSRRRLSGEAPAAPRVVQDTLTTGLRRVVRRSLVLQVLRLRVVSVTSRLANWISPPEPPLQSYAEKPAARIGEGLRISVACVRDIAEDASRAGARTMVMLVPARFQLNDEDYGMLKAAVDGAGGTLVRDAATVRFAEAFRGVVPVFDTLPALRASGAGSALFFQHTVHLTPRGHEIVAEALEAFLRRQGLL